MASRGSAWCSWAYTCLTSVFVSFIMNSFPLNLEFANFNNLLMHTSQPNQAQLSSILTVFGKIIFLDSLSL